MCGDLLATSLMNIGRELGEGSRQSNLTEVLANPFEAFSVELI